MKHGRLCAAPEAVICCDQPRGWTMHWLFLLMAVGALYVGFSVTSTAVMVISDPA